MKAKSFLSVHLVYILAYIFSIYLNIDFVSKLSKVGGGKNNIAYDCVNCSGYG